MILQSGTVAQFTGSLAEQIEAAFTAELYAVKGIPLPDAGKQERRILFCAIAQATLAFLAANPSGLQVDLTAIGGGPDDGTVEVSAPTLTATGSGGISGAGWPGATVRLTATSTGAVQTATVQPDGTISASFDPATRGVIDARDDSGNAAQAVI